MSKVDLLANRGGVVWLYCLVFPATHKKKSEGMLEEERNIVLDALIAAKLDIQLFYSSTKQHIFCKVGAKESRLLLEADIAGYKLPIDPVAIKKICESDRDLEPYGRAPIFLEFPLPDSVDLQYEFKRRDPILGRWSDMTQSEVAKFIAKETTMSPWESLYIKYNDAWESRLIREHEVQVYQRYDDGTILRPADRIRLCKMAIERAATKDPEHHLLGAGLFLKELIYDGIITATYPLQLGTSRQTSKELTPDQLFERWNKGSPWNQPLDTIRDYAGEKIALYFAFLGHYTKWLLIPAFIGSCIFVHQLAWLNRATGSFNVLSSAATRIKVVNNTDGSQSLVTEIYTKVPEAPFFAFFISLWASFLIEFWKRKQARLALRWGMSDFEQDAHNRVEFKPTHQIPSPVTGQPVEYYSKTNFFAKLLVSASVLVFAITVVVAAIAGILVLKVILSPQSSYEIDVIPSSVAPQLALVVNAIVIILLGNVYKIIARKLNDWENHRTDIQYEDHLIMKTFVFSFVNSYATLTYMAFIKSGQDIFNVAQYCIADAETLVGFDRTTIVAADQCYGALTYSLFIIFASQIIVNNTMEVGVPFIMARVMAFLDFRAHAKRLQQGVERVGNDVKSGLNDVGDAVGFHKNAKVDAGEEKDDLDVDLEDSSVRRRMKSPLEYQLYLKQYESTFDDLLEIALQFGYVTLFVSAFPIAPLLALLNNILEVRVDSYKVCLLSRRPDIIPAQDLGTWQSVFSFMGLAAVVSNAAVILFTTDFVVASDSKRVWLWVIFVGVVLGIKKTVDYVIPDVPSEVQIQLQRQEFIFRKVFLLERDEETLSAEEKRRISQGHKQSRSIQAVDPFLYELSKRAAEILKLQKGESWDASEIFDKADVNNNGTISIKELKKALLEDPDGLITSLTKYEIQLLVSSLDVDGDGVIDKQEFLRFLNIKK